MPSSCGAQLGHADGVGVRERRRRQRGQPLRGEALARLVVGLLLVLRDLVGVDAEERRQRGARVLRVGVDLAGLERPEGDLLRPEVQALADLVAAGRERLRVDLAEDELLREVLRPDRQRRRGVRGVAVDRLGGGRVLARGRRRLADRPSRRSPVRARASRSGAAARASMRPRLSRARQTAGAGVRRLLDEAGLLEVALGHLRGLLLVDVDAGVELLHHLLGQRLLHVLDDLLALGAEVLRAPRCGSLNVTL